MFTYANLLDEVKQFNKMGVETGIVGESMLKQPIPYVFYGNKNGNRMVVQGAIHAREHLTALLVVYLCKYLVKNALPINGGIYFVPMVNPDGVRLCQEGVNFIDNGALRQRLVDINGGTNFSLWKANANAVDLNVNFDAAFGTGKQNVFAPAPSDYVGECPFSEPETRALAEFTLRLSPLVTLSYHLKGEIVYWDFGQTVNRRRDEGYAKAIAAYTGYSLVGSGDSAGGYKDWCVRRLGIPSFTIEVGEDSYSHPFPYTQFQTILRQNLDLPRRLLNTVVKDGLVAPAH